MIRFATPLAAALLSLSPPPAVAAETRDAATFDFYVGGFSAGVVSYAGVQNGSRYAVSGVFQTAGLAALFNPVRYDASVSGQATARGFVPGRYRVVEHRGTASREQTIRYADGVPTAVEDNPARPRGPFALDPTGQRGTIDTLTAIFATLRPVPRAEACNQRVEMFDGMVRSALVLGTPEANGATISCAGEYRRVAGYSPQEMAERPSFPFRMTYADAGDGMVRVGSITMDSLYGQASLVRR